MGDAVSGTVRAVTMENFALYIEGEKCPFSYIQRHRGCRGELPYITCVIPALEFKVLDKNVPSGFKLISPKDIPPRAKVVLVMRDPFITTQNPSFVILFEGELTNPGFTRTPDQKNFQFIAKHILSNLQGLTLTALDPGGYIEEIISGRIEENVHADAIISDTIFELFSPKKLGASLGIDPDKLDIYDFCKGALSVYLTKAKTSPTKKAWPIKAADAYGFLDRMFSKTEDKTKHVPWKHLYHLIMQYSFMELIPKTGGARISFLQMIQLMSQLFLHEVDIMPDPPSYQVGIMIKPDAVFLNPPECNIIYPIFLTTLPYFEQWDNKPTRLTQITHPASGVDAVVLRPYLRTISPPSLRNKFKAYQEATAAVRATMDLVTKEEEIRGIVDSYNEIPAFLSAAMSVISNEDDPYGKKETTGKLKVKGVASPTSGTVETSTTIGLTDNLIINKTVYKAVFHKKLFHEFLYNMEHGLTWDAETTFGGAIGEYQKGGDQAIPPNAPKMTPKRIYILPADATPQAGHCNYTVVNNSVVQNLGRSFHIFQEPLFAVPLALRLNLPGPLKPKPKQYPYMLLFSDKEEPNTQTNPLHNDANDITLERSSASIIDSNSVSGFTHSSIALAIDKASVDLAGQLVAIICELCELSVTLGNGGDIKTTYDELGDKFSVLAKTDAYVSLVQQTQTKAEEWKIKMRAIAEERYQVFINQKEKNKATDLNKKAPKDSKLAPPIKKVKSIDPKKVVPEQKTLLKKPAPKFTKPKTVDLTISPYQNYLEIKNQLTSNMEISTSFTFIEKSLSTVRVDDTYALIWFLFSTGGGRTTSIIEAYSPNVSKTTAFRNFQTSIENLMKKGDKTNPKGLEALLQDSNNSNIINNDIQQFIKLFGYILVATTPGKPYVDYRNLIYRQFKIAKALPTNPTPSAFLISLYSAIFATYPQPTSAYKEFVSFIEAYRQSYPIVEGYSLALQRASENNKSSLIALADIVDYTIPKTTDTPPEINKGAPVDTAEKTPENTEKSQIDKAAEKVQTYKDLQQEYIEPMCDYYFYKNRHESSSTTLQMEFNPYITPGYSSIILDTKNRFGGQGVTNLKGFVLAVDDAISPESITTSVAMGYLRKADSDIYEDMLNTTDETQDGTDLPYNYGPPDIVSKSHDSEGNMVSSSKGIPFFSGEWENSYDSSTQKWQMDEIYQKVLGCNMWQEAKGLPGLLSEIESTDYIMAMEALSRNIQRIRFINAPSSVQTEYDKQYLAAPGLVLAQWNNYEFPNTITMFTADQIFFDTAKKTPGVTTKDEKNNGKKQIPYDPATIELIRKMRILCSNKTATQG